MWEFAMVQAIVLVQAEVGESAAVARAVAKLAGVTAADVVTGPYDVIARVEAENIDELGRMVVSSIQSVPSVTRTLTCPIIRF
jgi:DNA-binding Lrp family transcriptional regulator